MVTCGWVDVGLRHCSYVWLRECGCVHMAVWCDIVSDLVAVGST